MINILLFFLLKITVQPMPMCHKIIPIAQAKKMVKKQENLLPNKSYQAKGTLAFVHYLKSGEIIMIPNDLGTISKNAFLFENEKCFDLINSTPDSILLKEENDVFAQESDVIKEIPKSFPIIIKKLCERINISIPDDSIDIDNTSLLFLIEQTKKDYNTLSAQERVYLCLLLGEYIVRTNSAQWGIEQEYGVFTSYDVPVLVIEEDRILKLRDYFISLTKWSNKRFADLIVSFPVKTYSIEKIYYKDSIRIIDMDE